MLGAQSNLDGGEPRLSELRGTGLGLRVATEPDHSLSLLEDAFSEIYRMELYQNEKLYEFLPYRTVFSTMSRWPDRGTPERSG